MDASEQFPLLSRAAHGLLGLHVTTPAAERNWSAWGRVYDSGLRSRLGVKTATNLVQIKSDLRAW